MLNGCLMRCVKLVDIFSVESFEFVKFAT
jgi:hypothetical protein